MIKQAIGYLNTNLISAAKAGVPDLISPRGIETLADGGESAVGEETIMSCSHVKKWVNLMTRLLIGCSLLRSQLGASLLVDPTLDYDYNS